MEMFGMTGERLGTIGPAEIKKDLHQTKVLVPGSEWKKSFLPGWSASVRKGIALDYNLPHEDASVLVLTAPSGKFVDVRFPHLNNSSLLVQGQDVISKHPAYWVFSGTVRTTFLEHPHHHHGQQQQQQQQQQNEGVNWPHSAHAVFTHEIDSKGPDITDEGDMFVLPNGDTMEVGVWTSPRTGKLEMYKEYWTAAARVPFSSGRGGEHVSSAAAPSKSGDSSQVCVVVETGLPANLPVRIMSEEGETKEEETKEKEKEKRKRGIMIRIGNYCQAILERNHDEVAENKEDRVAVERWERWASVSPDGGSARWEWVRDPRSNTREDGTEIPSRWVLDMDIDGDGSGDGSSNAKQECDGWFVTEKDGF